MSRIRVALAGVGNCASALVQGLSYYAKHKERAGRGLIHSVVGPYDCSSIDIVAAFDIDRRKVGRPLHEAIFAPPNCTARLGEEVPDLGVTVVMAPPMDGVSNHMRNQPPDRSFVLADETPVDIAETLRSSGADILVNYMPVGSEQAARAYAEACLSAGVAMINCIPVFLASSPEWAERFRNARLPIIGDDIKSQVGATIVHRTLARLFEDRGVRLQRTYQLNTGGNTDFLNMQAVERLESKRQSKTQAVQSALDIALEAENIHVGPSGYVPWQNDDKVCFIRMEGLGFGDQPIELELRMKVPDSPNSAGVVMDAIRFAKLGLDRGEGGPLLAPCAYFMKSPPTQMREAEARAALEDMIADAGKA